MYKSLKAETKGKPWLVATGSLTNVALLFASFPDLVKHIGGLSIMGGAIGGGFTEAPMGHVKGEGEGERFGNVGAWAEFNIYVRFVALPHLRSSRKTMASTSESGSNVSNSAIQKPHNRSSQTRNSQPRLLL